MLWMMRTSNLYPCLRNMCCVLYDLTPSHFSLRILNVRLPWKLSGIIESNLRVSSQKEFIVGVLLLAS